MDTRAVLTEAIVLKGRDYSEADRILILFTRELGKISAIAKSVRKPKSSLRAATQLFAYSRLSVLPGRGLATITQGETIDSLWSLREDLDKIAYASYFAELVDCILPEGKPQQKLFILLEAVYTLLDAVEDYELIARYFELKLLAMLGYKPQLSACAVCGRSLTGGVFSLSPAKGGIVCRSCDRDFMASVPMSNGAIATMDRMLKQELSKWFNLKVSPEFRKEIEAGVSAYMEYYLERTRRAKALLREFTSPY